MFHGALTFLRPSDPPPFPPSHYHSYFWLQDPGFLVPGLGKWKERVSHPDNVARSSTVGCRPRRSRLFHSFFASLTLHSYRSLRRISTHLSAFWNHFLSWDLRFSFLRVRSLCDNISSDLFSTRYSPCKIPKSSRIKVNNERQRRTIMSKRKGTLFQSTLCSLCFINERVSTLLLLLFLKWNFRKVKKALEKCSNIIFELGKNWKRKNCKHF